MFFNADICIIIFSTIRVAPKDAGGSLLYMTDYLDLGGNLGGNLGVFLFDTH